MAEQLSHRTAVLIAAAMAAGALGLFALAVSSAKAEERKPSPLLGCFGEVSAAGAFLAAGDRLASGAIGAGCTMPVAGLVVAGGGARADFGSVKSGSAYGRLGLKLNDNLIVYGLAQWNVPDWHVGSTGQLAIGGGVETTIVLDGLSGFVEATSAVSKWGVATRDDFQIRAGARYAVPGLFVGW